MYNIHIKMDNFSKINLLGCTWYKNKWNNKKGKSDCPDKLLIGNRKKDQIMVLSHKKKGRMYTLTSPDKLLKLVSKDRGIHEHILSDMKRKVYFDTDKDNNLVEALQLLRQVFPNCRINVNGYVNKNHKKKGKIIPVYHSYHIVLDNYHLDNYEETKKLHSWIKSINKDRKILGKTPLFDTEVYKSQQLFKTVNQGKKKDDNNDGIPSNIILGSRDPKDHLITCFFKEDSINATSFIPEVIEPKSKNKIKVIDIDLSIYEKEPLKQLNGDFNVFICSPKDLVYSIPNHPRGHENCLSHDITYKIALYCYDNYLSFADFWGWASHKDDTPERKKRWFRKWHEIDLDVHECELHPEQTPKHCLFIRRYHIIAILECFYPNIKKDQNLRKFKEAHNIKETIKIDSCWMSKKDFTDKKYHVVNIGMGGNKTGATIDYLQDIESFAWLTPRRTLATDTKSRLEKNNINVVDYRSVKNKKLSMTDHNKLIINAESLHYLYHSSEKSECKKFDIVIVDEIETVNNSWKSTETHKQNIYENWRIMSQLFLNAKKVILLDAFMSQKTIDLINAIEKNKTEIDIYKAQPRDIQRFVKLIGAMKTNKHKKTSCDVWLNMIIHDIKNGKKPFIFYPHKAGNKNMKSIDLIKDIIIKNTNLKSSDIPIYHADVSDQKILELSDVNDLWKDSKAVICNSAITVGVSYDRSDIHMFDNIYMGWAPFLLPRDMVQATARCRHLKEGNIYVFKCSGLPCRDFDKLDIHKSTYNNCLRPHLMIENRSRQWDAFIYMCQLANYKIDENIMINMNFQDYENEIETNSIFDYNSIPTTYINTDNEEVEVDSKYVSKATSKIYVSKATQKEKLIVAKYMFEQMFKKNTPDNLKSVLWTGKSEPFLRNYLRFMNDEIEWLYDLKEELKCDNLILPKNIKLSKQLRNKIFNTYDFDRLSINCSDEMLLSRALSIQFSMQDFFIFDKKSRKWIQPSSILIDCVFNYLKFEDKDNTDYNEYQFDD